MDPAIVTMQECAEQPRLKKNVELHFQSFSRSKFAIFWRWGFVSGLVLLEMFLVGLSAPEEAAALC